MIVNNINGIVRDILKMPGMEEAMIGLSLVRGTTYDRDKVAQILVQDSEMDYLEAEEWIDFNILRHPGVEDHGDKIIVRGERNGY